MTDARNGELPFSQDGAGIARIDPAQAAGILAPVTHLSEQVSPVSPV